MSPQSSSVNPAEGVPSILVENKRQPTQRQLKIERAHHPEMLAAHLLKTGREELGMSQEQVATAMNDLGFSWRQTTVAKTEAATRPIRVNELVALAGVLGVDVRQLLGKLGENWNASARMLVATAQLTRAHRKVETLATEIDRVKAEIARAEAAVKAAEKNFRENIAEFDLEVPDADGQD